MSNSNIGTLDEAETAAIIHMVFSEQYEATVMPEGWTYLGAGVQRYVYEAPSGVVYKVPVSKMRNDANYAEAQAAASLSPVPSDEFGVPETNLFEIDNVPVIAMENCGNEAYELFGDKGDRAIAYFRNGDIHSGNVRWFKGKVYMIDLGFYRPDYPMPRRRRTPSPMSIPSDQKVCVCGDKACGLMW